jgi:hypothetical protein
MMPRGTLGPEINRRRFVQSATGQRVKDLAVAVRSGVPSAPSGGRTAAPAPAGASGATAPSARAAQPTRLPAGPSLSTIPLTPSQPAATNGHVTSPR